MSEETKTILIKRLKSFGWRLGAYAAVSSLAFIAENIGILHLSPVVITLVTLACGELTKYLNTTVQQ